MSSVVTWALLAIAADRLTKFLMTRTVPAGGRPVFAQSWVEIRPAGHHYSVSRTSDLRVLMLYGMVLGGLLLLIHFGLLFQQPHSRAALGLAIGGATSNLYERLRYRRVLNFVRVGCWPVFNFADIAICLGAVAALINLHS